MKTLTAPRSILFPTANNPTYIIDPMAFFIALISAPVAVTLITFWVLLIPVFALILGGPAFLIIGTPLLLWYLRHNDVSPLDIAALAALADLALMAAMVGIAMLKNHPNEIMTAMYYGGFGLIFAPLWGGTFGWLYLKMRRDLYAPRRLI